MDNDTFDSAMARLFRASRYAERVIFAAPGLREWLRARVEQSAVSTVAALATTPMAEHDSLHATLRQRRKQAMLAIMFRDINGLANWTKLSPPFQRLPTISFQHRSSTTKRHCWPNLAVSRRPTAIC